MKKFILSTLLLFSESSFAGFLIEPIFAQYSGSFSSETVPAAGSLQTNESLSGGGFGLLAAYTFSSWFVGPTFRTADADTTINTMAATRNFVDMGLVFGKTFSNGFRAFAAYIFDHKHVESIQSAEQTTTYTGSGIRLGFGYMFKNQITINADYTAYTYNKSEGAVSLSPLSLGYSKFQYAPMTVSFGYAFGGNSK